jgi:hypothetical protein
VRLDGVERAPFVPLARLVAVSHGTTVEEPPYVWVEWSPGILERPYPGSAVWRAALQHYLLRPTGNDPAAHLLRPIIAACLERFPTLESWMRWTNQQRVVPEAGTTPRRRHAWLLWPTGSWPW